MIDKLKVRNLVEEKLEENMFLVDITVSSANVINVYIDSFNGLTIEQCINISRHLEHSFDREDEDFELQVSSPGLTESFKVIEQYRKYMGREIVVLTETGIKLEGKLVEATNDDILIEISKREKVEGQKKKQLIVKEHKLIYEEISSAKAVISFK